MYRTLTPLQKLFALAAKNYQGIKWTPQTGDYYTSARADLELYQVIEVKDGIIKTIYCDKQCSPQSWDETEFTTIGFGLHRVHVPLWILEQIDTNKCNIVPDENHVVVEILPENVADTLSSLTLTNYEKWVQDYSCGICSNICSILKANNSVKLINVRPFVNAIISKLSFLFYHNNNDCNINGWCSLPIPKVSSLPWQNEELQMRVKYANWLSTQLNLYLKTQGGEI